MSSYCCYFYNYIEKDSIFKKDTEELSIQKASEVKDILKR